MLKFARRFSADRSGATAIEYGLIAAMVVVVIVGALSALGQQLLTLFNSVAGAFGG